MSDIEKFIEFCRDHYSLNMPDRIVKDFYDLADTLDFEKALQVELDKLPFTKGVDDGQYKEGVIDGFEIGSRWAIKIKTV